MCQAVAHRGTGVWDIWYDNPVALGHAPGPKDPLLGQKPLAVKRDGIRYGVVCDSRLVGSQHDAASLLEAYHQHGEDCVKHLKGTFAFCVWDGGKEQLFLARDPLGSKPLFYLHRDGVFLFGSQIKALTRHPAFSPVVRREGLLEVLGVGPGRTPGEGVFEGVRELKPGECLRVNREGLTTRTYWELAASEHAESVGDTIAHTRDLLFTAIRRQLNGPEAACSLLSGGLDSSVLTAYTAQQYHAQGLGALATFSFDFKDNAQHFAGSAFQPEIDAPYALQVADYCGTNHRQLLCDNEALAQALPDAMGARDLPGMADIDASLLLLCGQLKPYYTAALSGECADEVFGGYPWFHQEKYLTAHTFPWNTDPSARMQVIEPMLALELGVQEHVQARYEQMLAAVPRLPGETGSAARMREIAFLNLYGFMQTLAERADRMGMAHGVSILTPFSDPELVAYVFNIPWEIKALGGETKGLLRAASKGLLPESILHRKKSPFPKTYHPLYEQLLQRRMRGVLDDANAPVRRLIDIDRVQKLLTGQSDVGKPWFGQLMAGPQLMAWLLQIDDWLRAYRVEIRL